MKQYYKIIDGRYQWYNGRIIVGDMQIINPPEELILADGWTEYIPEPYFPQPEIEPDEAEIVEKLKWLVQPQIAEMSDEDAIKVAELFPAWFDQIGKWVAIGDRLWYDKHLYKVIQPHIVAEEWKPNEAASLYQVIDAGHSGTPDDPIPWVAGMACELDKYYWEDNVEYRCIRDSQGIGLYYSCAELVAAAYMEVV